MKSLIIILVALSSSVTFASGFRCEGQGYRVKLYNQVQPSRGTKNPAIIIVSSEQSGTVLRLQDIEKTLSARTVTYSGLANAVATGRFMQVRLEIVKEATQTGEFAGSRFAVLTINADGGSTSARLACVPYLKGE